MKLVRYGKPGKEKPGLIDSDGRLRDLSAVVADIGPDQLSDPALARLRKLKSDTLPLVKGSPRMGCPVAGIGKFIAIGLNYADHAAEAGMPIPAEPIVFMKATSCIQGPDDPVMLPKGSKKSDWEVELGVVIGRTGTACVTEGRAVAMWPATAWSTTSANEPSRSSAAAPGTRGKGCDTFGPIGPWLVTRG
jgi:2,4-diketo-3-deoxy-L-fuconate hydrolase